jgi:carotenoid cleavage dioxygenase-like enzyme
MRNRVNPNVNKKIILSDFSDESILSKINGFYGLIGPKIDIKKTNSLIDFFMGNGMIQGIFFDNGNLTFINTAVLTDKKIMENNWKSFAIFKDVPSFELPNMMGVANTAFFTLQEKVYALFERDVPYEIDVDFQNKKIDTIGKRKIDDISHFSAHPKKRFSNAHSYIETIDYDVIRKKTTIYQLDNDFRILSSIIIPMKYRPIIHDFISTPNSIVLLNSPFKIHLSFPPSFPLDSSKSSIFYLFERNTGKIIRYYSDSPLYIFHYADIYETENELEIYAPVYDSLDFLKLSLNGKYRKIILDKKSKKVSFIKNPELEELNLELPVVFFHDNKNKIILRYIENERNIGFIICHKLDVLTKIPFIDRCICGEPSIVVIEDMSYLLFFTMDDSENGYFNILDLTTEKNIEISLKERINIGFHSLFLPLPTNQMNKII